jgi:hypothetical protein
MRYANDATINSLQLEMRMAGQREPLSALAVQNYFFLFKSYSPENPLRTTTDTDVFQHFKDKNSFSVRPWKSYSLCRPPPVSPVCVLSEYSLPTLPPLLFPDQISLGRHFSIPCASDGVSLHIKGKKRNVIMQGYRYSFSVFRSGQKLFKRIEMCSKPWEVLDFAKKLEQAMVENFEDRKNIMLDFKQILSNTKFPFRLRYENGLFFIDDCNGKAVHVEKQLTRKNQFGQSEVDQPLHEIFFVEDENELFIHRIFLVFYELLKKDKEDDLDASYKIPKDSNEINKRLNKLLDYYIKEIKSDCSKLNGKPKEQKVSYDRVLRLLRELCRLIDGFYAPLDTESRLPSNPALKEIRSIFKKGAEMQIETIHNLTSRLSIGLADSLNPLCTSIAEEMDIEDRLTHWKVELGRLATSSLWKKWRKIQSVENKEQGAFWRIKRNALEKIFEVVFTELLQNEFSSKSVVKITPNGPKCLKFPNISLAEIQRGDNVLTITSELMKIVPCRANSKFNFSKLPSEAFFTDPVATRQYFLSGDMKFLTIFNENERLRIFRVSDMDRHGAELMKSTVQNLYPSRLYLTSSPPSRQYLMYQQKDMGKDWMLTSLKMNTGRCAEIDRTINLNSFYSAELKRPDISVLAFPDGCKPLASAEEIIMVCFRIENWGRDTFHKSCECLVGFIQDAQIGDFLPLNSHVLEVGDKDLETWNTPDPAPKVSAVGFKNFSGDIYFLLVTSPPFKINLFKYEVGKGAMKNIKIKLSTLFKQKMSLDQFVTPTLISVDWNTKIQKAMILLGYSSKQLGKRGHKLPAVQVSYIVFT